MISGADYNLVANLLGTGITTPQLFIKKPSSILFTEIVLEVGDFAEAEDNYYNFVIKLEDTVETGTYVFKVSENGNDHYFEREALPQPLSSTPAPGVCLVTGNVRNISGIAKAYNNSLVSAQPLQLPAQNSGTLILGHKAFSYADHDGYFSLPLIIGMTVLIEIPDAGVRFQAVIPDQATIKIEDLMPND